ncbi:MAG: hypothetical protein ACKVT1_14035 [Dehalococcoidia bacterium]
MTEPQVETQTAAEREAARLERDAGVQERVAAAFAYIRNGGKGVRPRDAKKRAI